MSPTVQRRLCIATIVATMSWAAPAVSQCSTDQDCDGCFPGPCVNGVCTGENVCVELQCDAPSLTCPESFTTTLPAGASSGVVTFPDPASTPSSGEGCFVNLVCAPASGSSFPIGDTTVTCTLDTVLSEPITCSFVATVLAAPIPMLSGSGFAALATLLGLAGAGVLLRGRA
jgi:hypothetical protein